MNYAGRQFGRDQWENAVASQYTKAAVRPLGALEHLFWLYDQNRSAHFAVTALISGRTRKVPETDIAKRPCADDCEFWQSLEITRKRK
jgi:hypothetical protein